MACRFRIPARRVQRDFKPPPCGSLLGNGRCSVETPIALPWVQMQTATCRTRFLSSEPARSEGMAACPLNAHWGALRETVLRTIAAKGYSELRTVEVVVTDGRVVLRGTVASFYMKQVAQTAVCMVPGVNGLCNEIEVMPAGQRPEWLASGLGGLDGRRSMSQDDCRPLTERG